MIRLFLRWILNGAGKRFSLRQLTLPVTLIVFCVRNGNLSKFEIGRVFLNRTLIIKMKRTCNSRFGRQTSDENQVLHGRFNRCSDYNQIFLKRNCQEPELVDQLRELQYSRSIDWPNLVAVYRWLNIHDLNQLNPSFSGDLSAFNAFKYFELNSNKPKLAGNGNHTKFSMIRSPHICNSDSDLAMC